MAQVSDRQLDEESQTTFAQLAPVGMAVAVVRKNKPVWTRGFGLRESGKDGIVDADTPFPIHSMTKSFTATALALLVDEGKIAWDDPVRQHIPEFAMSDPYVTEHLTIRDLLVHNSGLALGAGDLLHWPDQRYTTGDIIAGLRYLPLEKGLRQGFAYDNLLYFMAGEVVARASGMTWSAFLHTRLLEPLGMSSCSTSTQDTQRHGGVSRIPAIQHARPAGGKPSPLPGIVQSDDPAGSLSCSVRDIARWMQFQLGDGTTPDGIRLLTAQRLDELHTAVVAMKPPRSIARLAGSHFNDVALGWFVSDFAGSYAIEHGGTGPGGMTNMILLPEQGAAVVVLVNDMVPAMMLSNRIADLIVRGDNASDWMGWVKEREARRAAQASSEHDSNAQPPISAQAPRLPLDAYAGNYRDPWYGLIRVTRQKQGLRLHFTRSKLLEGPLLPWDGETFIARWPDRSLEADAFVTFETNSQGKVTAMRVRPVSPRTDFSYDYAHLAPVREEVP